ncbi:MAG: alpha/beta fold hydrolase, partial [Acidobacteriota bacterium]|nr:alpha/beta fold hydrolase [Acidobacteriota bacterium]
MSDQKRKCSCEGSAPTYFRELDVPMTGKRAPLRALFVPPRERGGTIVIVVHGIFDSKYTKYIQVTADFLHRQGFGVLAPDMRWHGCLLEKEWLPTLGIQEGKDLVEWAGHLKREQPDSPIGLVGFSLGGLSVLHALGNDAGGNAFLAGGIAVCPAAGLPFTMEGLDAPAPLAD